MRALLLPLFCVACAASPDMMEKRVERGAGGITGTLWAEANDLWARRDDEASLREAIARWKRVVELRDDDHEAYLMLARACYFLGDGFLVFDPARKDELAAAFEEGLAFADRGLRALSPEFERKRRDGEPVDVAIGGLGRDAVPYLYWYANNLLRWAHLRGTFTVMKEHKRANALMKTVEQLDPAYFFGGADRYFGAFLAGAPGIAGGDLEDGRRRLEASLERAPHFFETRIYLAELYAVKKKDRALYVSALRTILDTPLDRLPEAAPENVRARKKAENLLKLTDRRF